MKLMITIKGNRQEVHGQVKQHPFIPLYNVLSTKLEGIIYDGNTNTIKYFYYDEGLEKFMVIPSLGSLIDVDENAFMECLDADIINELHLIVKPLTMCVIE